MKKCFLGIITVLMLITACASKPAASGGITLDQAIKEAAIRIDQEIEAGSKIALLNFSSPSDRFSSYVLDELTANLLDTKKLTVVDRKEVDLIRSEFDFQFSGEVGDDSMQELGRMLGAQSIVSGSLTEIGGDYRIVVRVLNVQSAAVAVQYRTDIAADRRVMALLEGGRSGGTATASGGRQTATGGTTQTTQPTQALPSPDGPFNIGDMGPAGGIIFYDKGSHSDGWRYLEAASNDVSGTAEWGAYDRNIGGMNTGRGAGKRNTQLIVEYLRSTGETGRAAQIAQECRQGGYDDWFLPSRDELNLLYENLKQKGLGRFQNDRYWSSSENESRNAWNQDFSDGRQYSDDYDYNRYKTSVRYVRPIRAF